MNNKINPKRIRSVKVEELLGRELIDITNESYNYIENNIVMVTGGGGSIGSELCRQIVKSNPKQLIILDNYENNAYDIQQELIREYKNSLDLKVVIATIRDYKRIFNIFKKYRPDIVFHAAAHKHVPLMEYNAEEAIKNNIFGTYNVAKISKEFNVKKFVLISSDKAVNPTNIMGATKRAAEMIIQLLNNKSSNTEYVAVRFGNVLGSNGSVIPLFKSQLEVGGPITITDPRIVRYFMTITEAVNLVLQAGGFAKGGEIFVLDMGEQVKIIDLIHNLIRLSGLNKDDIEIQTIGLRPGEKLYEELLMAEEGITKTPNKKIFISKPLNINEDHFIKYYSKLDSLMDQEKDKEVDQIMRKLVLTYITQEEANSKGDK